MDISFARVAGPPLRARFAPIYWEPLQGSAEQITTLIAIQPELDVGVLLAPAAHIVIPAKRLKAMLGAARGESAFGILREVEQFLTLRLASGLQLEELRAPFQGFTVGAAKRVRGFSVEQLITAAVQMVSSLGSAEEVLEDAIIATDGNATPTTREFLARVLTAFSGDDLDRRGRFHKALRVGDASETDVRVDYAHEKWLVQFASLPSTEKQAVNMSREAESKLFEVITARKWIDAATSPILLINESSLHTGSEEARKLAAGASVRFRNIARLHDVEPVLVKSKEEAVARLETLA